MSNRNAHAALNLSSRGYVLENGRIKMHGQGKDLLNSEEVKRHIWENKGCFCLIPKLLPNPSRFLQRLLTNLWLVTGNFKTRLRLRQLKLLFFHFTEICYKNSLMSLKGFVNSLICDSFLDFLCRIVFNKHSGGNENHVCNYRNRREAI